jgi:hypothetical protein
MFFNIYLLALHVTKHDEINAEEQAIPHRLTIIRREMLTS